MRQPFAIAAVIVLLAATACKDSRTADESKFSQAALDSALADPARAAQREAADARRKPGPLIALAGMKSGDKVLDLIPGDGYWTRIFSKIVGPEGKVYAVWPEPYARTATGNVQTLRQLSADKYYGNIVTEVQPTTTLTAPEPLDALKIDRGLITRISTSERDRIVVRSIFGLARELGLTVIVEGVESTAQLVLLAEWGCDLYQGFLGAGALDETELARFVTVSQSHAA
jgi:hypothetical protein